LELPPDSPILGLPWIVTFGPLSDDEDWEPVVCGPYERAHALALAEEVVADEELMAVVEPVMGFTTPDEIRAEIAAARAIAAESALDDGEIADLEAEFDDDPDLEAGIEDTIEGEPLAVPSPDEVRAGMIRIAQSLADQP
jgi:hypothetical protein